jgi:predicted nucleic acid-binding protein
MHKKVYFDTNVIVDLFDVARPFHRESLHVFQTIFEDEAIDVFINTDTMTNLFYILRSHIKLSFDEAIEKLEFIKDSFNIVSTENIEIEQTIDLCKKYIFNDYEDGMQYICALKVDCTLLITNNAKDFKNAKIEVVTSKELSDKLY